MSCNGKRTQHVLGWNQLTSGRSERHRPPGARTAESGYASARHSQLDPRDTAALLEVYDPVEGGAIHMGPQQGDYPYMYSGMLQDNTLAGIGVGALPLTDSIPRVSDNSIYAANGGPDTTVLAADASLGQSISPMNLSQPFGFREANSAMRAERFRGHSGDQPFNEFARPERPRRSGATSTRSLCRSLEETQATASSSSFPCPYSHCNKVKNRECDLR